MNQREASFERRMEQIKVGVDQQSSYIYIIQDYPGQDSSVVLVPPDQIDSLCKWLQEAKEAAEKQRR